MNAFAATLAPKNNWSMRSFARTDLPMIADWITALAPNGKLDTASILDQLRLDWKNTRQTGFPSDYLGLYKDAPACQVTAYRLADKPEYRLYFLLNPSLEYNNILWEQAIREVMTYFLQQPKTLAIRINPGPTNKRQERILARLGCQPGPVTGWYTLQQIHFKSVNYLNNRQSPAFLKMQDNPILHGR